MAPLILHFILWNALVFKKKQIWKRSFSPETGYISKTRYSFFWKNVPPSPHLAPQKYGKEILEIWSFESISYCNNTTASPPRSLRDLPPPPRKNQQKTSVDFSPIFFFFFRRFHRKFRIFFSWYPTPFLAVSPVSTGGNVPVSKRWKLHTPSWFHRAPASESWLNGSKFGDLQPWEQKSTTFWDIFLIEFQGYTKKFQESIS